MNVYVTDRLGFGIVSPRHHPRMCNPPVRCLRYAVCGMRSAGDMIRLTCRLDNANSRHAPIHSVHPSILCPTLPDIRLGVHTQRHGLRLVRRSCQFDGFTLT